MQNMWWGCWPCSAERTPGRGAVDQEQRFGRKEGLAAGGVRGRQERQQAPWTENKPLPAAFTRG